MNSGYSMCLNKWALDKEIKNELGLLLIISSLCAEKGYCYASNKYLSNEFGETEQSISNKIKKLEQKKYIEINYKKRGCEIISREIRLKNIYTDDIKSFIPTIEKVFKDNNISNKNISNKNIYIVQFEELWKKYPNKKGKSDALKHYTKYRKQGVTHEEIEEGLNKYIQYCKNTEWYTPKNGSSWFNQKSWEDDWGCKKNNGGSASERELTNEERTELLRKRFAEAGYDWTPPRGGI